MSDLPAERLTPNKPPFYFTGVDFLVPSQSVKVEATSKNTAAFLLALHLGQLVWSSLAP